MNDSECLILNYEISEKTQERINKYVDKYDNELE